MRMTVEEFIKELQNFPPDAEIVSVNDYIQSPSVYINSYATGERDKDGNLIIRDRVEIH